MMELNKIYNMDCLEGMRQIPDGSIDCIICDLPYGTTENEWDCVIPLDKLWEQYKRIAKPTAAICLFAQCPFDKVLGCSNLKWLRYEWIWTKYQGTGFMNANKMPLKIHENILVFYKKLPTYNQQRIKSEKDIVGTVRASQLISTNYNRMLERTPWIDDGTRCPVDVINFGPDSERVNSSITNKELHPTQKPVDLLRYLVRTYSNEGETILDNCMGSGTTAIACIKEKRNFIGFELNTDYYTRATKRIQAEQSQLTLF